MHPTPSYVLAALEQARQRREKDLAQAQVHRLLKKNAPARMRRWQLLQSLVLKFARRCLPNRRVAHRQIPARADPQGITKEV